MTPDPFEPDHIRALRDQLARFVAAEAPPERRRAWEAQQDWPREVFAKLAALGLCGLTVPEEHGGLGQDVAAAVAVVEELSVAGTFLSGPFIHCAFYGGMNIAENGSAEQKAQMLPKLAKGEMFLAYGLTEPDVGGDLSAVKTRVRRDGDHVVVDGAKRWATGARFADYLYCLCRSDPDAPARAGLTFILVPLDAPGVTIADLGHTAMRYTRSCDVMLEGVRLPASAIVGGEAGWGRGWSMLAGRALDVEKLEVAAVAFGIARACVDEAWTYAQTREQFGKPISGHQAVRHALVDARTKLEACRHLLTHAARLASAGHPCGVESSMAKLFVAETAVEIGLACQRVVGSYALEPGCELDRGVRDLLSFPIVGGSSNMQRNNIAAMLRLKA